MDLSLIFGQNVRAIRLSKGMSQEQLAFEAEMKRSYVSDLERGGRNPTIKAVERLAAALGVQPSLLFEFRDPSA